MKQQVPVIDRKRMNQMATYRIRINQRAVGKI